MFIFANQPWPTPLNHQRCEICSEIPKLREVTCIFSIHQTETWHSHVFRSIFLVGMQSGFLAAALNILMLESLSCDLKGEKLLCFFLRHHLDPVICEVIALWDLQILFMHSCGACCGYSEAMTCTPWCFPPTHTIKPPSLYHQDCCQSQL